MAFFRNLEPRVPGSATTKRWGHPASVRWFAVAVLLGAAVLRSAPRISAAEEPDPYAEEIKGFEKETQSLESDASVLLTITILVAIFGVVAGGLQAWAHQSVRIATAILGLTIASLTAVDQAAFDIDHRQCRRLAL